MKVSWLILKLFWNTTQYSCINRHLGKCQISRNIAPLNSSLHKPATNHHPGPVSPYPLGPRWFYWHAQCSWLIPTPSTRTQAGHYSLHARATAGPSTLPASTDFRPDRWQVWNWHSDGLFRGFIKFIYNYMLNLNDWTHLAIIRYLLKLRTSKSGDISLQQNMLL